MSETQVMAALKNIGTGVVEIQGDLKMIEQRVTDLEGGANADKKKFYGSTRSESREDFSFGKALKICVLTAMGTLGQDKELVNSKELKIMGDAAVTKAMDSGTGGAGGGYVIPQQYIATLIEMLRANLVVVQAGATLMDGLVGSPVLVPKQLTGTSLQWIGQNATITAGDAGFGQIQLTPKTGAIRCQYSNLLGILSNPSMESIIRRDLSKVMALGLDLAALRGTGSANQPLGVNGVSNLGTYTIGTGNGGDLTRQDMLKLVGVVEDANALVPGGKFAFITSPKAKRVLKNERIAQYSGQTLGEYQIYPLSDKALQAQLDYPVLTTTQVPVNLTTGASNDCTEVYFGNWEELLIGTWGGLEILATNIGGNAWAQNAIELRLIQNCDVQVRHGQSFVLCNSARTNNA